MQKNLLKTKEIVVSREVGVVNKPIFYSRPLFAGDSASSATKINLSC